MIENNRYIASVYNFFCSEDDALEEGLDLDTLTSRVNEISRDVMWKRIDSSDSKKVIEIKGRIKQLKREGTTIFKGIDIKNIRIVAPDTPAMKVFYAATLVPRIIFVFARSILHLIMFGISSFWYKNEHQNSRKIRKAVTPIILIHGMSSNQRQFDVTRLFLEKEYLGHVFTLNLNKSPVNNDEDATLESYAQKIDDYILSIKKRYAEAGYDLKDVILVGHSMGGLVAGQYAENQGKQDGHLAPSAVITLNTPWHGALLADRFLGSRNASHEVLKTTSEKRKELVERVEENIGKYYNFSSTMDPMVPGKYGVVAYHPAKHIMSRSDCHFSISTASHTWKKIMEKWIIPNSHTVGAA